MARQSLSSLPPAIVLLGPPASGKGTHGKLLGGLPGFYHFSMGNAFRSRKPKTPEERRLMTELFQLTAQGNLVPDRIAMRMFREALAGLKASGQYDPSRQTIILDGIPRTRFQAEALVKIFDVRKLLVFVCPEKEIFRRVEGRAVAEGRADDANMGIVRHRLEVYRRELEPLLSFYPKSKVVRINAARPAYRVLASVLKGID